MPNPVANLPSHNVGYGVSALAGRADVVRISVNAPLIKKAGCGPLVCLIAPNPVEMLVSFLLLQDAAIGALEAVKEIFRSMLPPRTTL